jgi:hypothetical protein
MGLGEISRMSLSFSSKGYKACPVRMRKTDTVNRYSVLHGKNTRKAGFLNDNLRVEGDSSKRILQLTNRSPLPMEEQDLRLKD